MTETFYEEYAILKTIFDSLNEYFEVSSLFELDTLTLAEIDFDRAPRLAKVDLTKYGYAPDLEARVFFRKVISRSFEKTGVYVGVGDCLYGLRRALYGYMTTCVLANRYFRYKAKEEEVSLKDWLASHASTVSERATLVNCAYEGVYDIIVTIDAFIQPVVV